MHHLQRKGLNLQVDAGDLRAAFLLMAAGALAELGKADMPVLAQFQPGGDQHAVDVHAGLALELEEHAHRACIVSAAAQNPAATAENCTRENLDQIGRAHV